jgi:hypothetical protein
MYVRSTASISNLRIEGIIGLTTAITIQERGGYHVTVVSEVHPSDPKTIKYTSHWAVSICKSVHSAV